MDLERVRERLMAIVLEGEDRDSIAAAHVLLNERKEPQIEGPDEDRLVEIAEGVRRMGL